MYITIDGETMEVQNVYNYIGLPWILADGGGFYLAESREDAGKEARKKWADMANNDPEEFACLVGESTLVAWALGQYAGLGAEGVNCLSDWLDLWLDSPEEEFAGYDGEEHEARGPSHALLEELNLDYDDSNHPWVAYRTE